MKRVSAFLLCLFLIGALALPCTAASSRVRTDTALSEQESAYLDTLFDAVLETFGVEAFFVINYDYRSGDEFRTYVTDYLDRNKQTADAMVFAVSADNYRLHSLGKAKEMLDGAIDTLYAAIADADAGGAQFTAAVQFYTALNSLLSERTGVPAADLPAPPAGVEIPPDETKSVCVRTDDVLTEAQTAHLQTLYQAIRDAHGVEGLFIINYDYAGGDAFNQYIDRYLEKNKQSDDVIIFAVSADNYRMIRRGKASRLLESGDLDTLYDAISEADENGEQYAAAVRFYAALDKLLAARTGGEGADADFTEIREIVPGSVPIPDEIQTVRGDRLVDQADLLSPAAEAALQEKLDRISEQMQFDVVIVTCEHIGSRTPMEFADDYFDYNGFGYGENFDGAALLISMAERDWWISTCGYGETALPDDYFMNFIDPSDFTYHLRNGRYDKSFNFFADTVEKFVTEAKTNKPYSEHHRFHMWSSMRTGLIWSVVIGLIVAAVTTYYKYNNYTGSVHTKGEANDYMVGRVHLTAKDDQFIRSQVYRERRVKPEPSSSSSGGSSHHSSGSHTSSSGRSHGGGGGKF